MALDSVGAAFRELVPHQARYIGALKAGRFVMDRDSDWRTDQLLTAAPVASTSRLLLRDAVTYH